MLTFDFDRLGVGPGSRVLDVGAGGGRHSLEALARGADVVAVDLDPAQSGGAREALTGLSGHLPAGSRFLCLAGDALRLPFADGTFDCVIASEVLEHIRDDACAIAELARVLRPGGSLGVSVPRGLPERVCWALSAAYHDFPGGHVRIYRAADLVAKLEAAGLTLTHRDHAHALHSPYWWLRCAVGPHDESHRAVRLFHALLVWDLYRRPWPTRALERALNPVLGKSLVLYAAA